MSHSISVLHVGCREKVCKEKKSSHILSQSFCLKCCLKSQCCENPVHLVALLQVNQCSSKILSNGTAIKFRADRSHEHVSMLMLFALFSQFHLRQYERPMNTFRSIFQYKEKKQSHTQYVIPLTASIALAAEEMNMKSKK